MKVSFTKILTVLFFASCNSVFYYPQEPIFYSPKKFGKTFSVINLETEDKEVLKVWHIPPEMNSSTVIIQFHGNAENMSTHFLNVLWLVDAGFDLVTFDYRGYGKSTGKPSRSGLIVDGKAVLKWAATTFPGKNIIVIGQSLGGAVAVPVIAESLIPNLKLLIVESSFDSYRSIAQEKLSSTWITWPFQWLPYLLISSEFNPIDYILKIKTPVIIAHSALDQVVSFAAAKNLFESANDPKEFWQVPWAGHISAFVPNDSPFRKKLVDRILAIQQKK